MGGKNKIAIYNAIAGTNRRIERLTKKLSEDHFFLLRLIYVFRLLVVYIISAAIHALALLFLSSASSFQYFHDIEPERGYTSSYSAYNSWRRRLQVSAVSSTIVIIVITVLNGLFLAQEQGDAANFMINCSGTSGSPTSVNEASFTTGDSLTFTDAGGSGYCELDNPLDVGNTGSVTIETGVILVHPAEDVDGVDITANSVTVTGSIVVDNLGCQGGSGANGDGYGPDTGSGNVCTISTAGFGDGVGAGGTDAPGGASHGGSGGASSDAVTAATYGEAASPVLLGSGGGSNGAATGGAGGGYIRITTPFDTGVIEINGVVSASGADGAGSGTDAGAGGSGGSIYLTTGFLSGSGSISASGGSGGAASSADRSGSGGGGGRIGLHTVNDTFTGSGTFSRAGGEAGSVSVSSGTQGTLQTTSYGPPSSPTNSAPTDGATGVSLTPTLTTSIYSDGDGGTHTSTDWWVYANATCSEPRDNALSDLVSSDLTSHVIGTTLSPHTEYSFVARYTDDVSLDSGFSDCTSFTTLNNTPTAAIATVSPTTEDAGSQALSASGSSDADSDTLSYTWTEITDSSDACEISSGSTTATPTVDLSNKDTDYACQYQVEVDDGYGGTDTETVTINVSADNDSPTVVSVSDKEVTAGNTVDFAVAASDPDSSTITLSAADSDDSFGERDVTSYFTDIGDGSGQFTWETSSSDEGSYVAAITASDGNSTDTEFVNISVNASSSSESGISFSGTLPSVSFAAGTTTNTLFDLDEYFSADETVTYSATGQERVIVNIADNGEVTMSAPASFAGSEAIVFKATGESGEHADSNPIVVSVSETLGITDIDHITGTSKGRGIITVYGADNEVLAEWQAFRKGGVVPRLALSGDESYVVALKRRSGSTTHIYTSQGNILKKRRLSPKLHFRKLAVGELNSKEGSIELVVATKRGSTIYFKIFSYKTAQQRIVLKKRAKYRPIKGKQYRATIQKNRIKLINKNGKTKFIWKPFSN